MGRPRTPSAILEAKGAFAHSPHRGLKRENEPTTDKPIGKPPANLSKAEKKVWKTLVEESIPGVLMESDRLHFALLVRLATKFYNNEPMMASEQNLLVSLGGLFAMNPSSRSKVSVEKKDNSKLGTFLSRKPAAQPQPNLSAKENETIM